MVIYYALRFQHFMINFLKGSLTHMYTVHRQERSSALGNLQVHWGREASLST